MPIDHTKVRDALRGFDFNRLFIEELGWDRPPDGAVSAGPGVAYVLRPVAHKRGMVVYVCEGDQIPENAARKKIEYEVAKAAHEHLIVYTDSLRTNQVWQWVRREPGRPAVSRQYAFQPEQPGDSLIQRLQALAFELDDEEDLTITAVAGRARQAFDVDRVTKRFFDRFKAEHIAFLKFVKGITSQGDCEWYASLMLNRLMFVYFIQKKGFLDGDTDYLRNRLRMTRAQRGQDKFHSFYRHFLLRLFHEGLGTDSRTLELDALLGNVPYLNGGLFDVHDLERANTAIDIADEAFEGIFDFFDAYNWHLDSRPLRADNEINPDVLGYIFEKYINQKELGAYYTKEDITEYIASTTVLPVLLRAANRESAPASELVGGIGQLLRDNPDRYIHAAVRRGVDVQLPRDIEGGITDVARRGIWNRPASEDVALPSETWREHIERRQRCLELRMRLASGKIRSIEEVVSENLDLSQLTHDFIATCESPDLLRTFYAAIARVRILDPACGSGAFLFAALNILQPLYEACLERMQVFLDDADRPASRSAADEFVDFAGTLAQASLHPNLQYFVLKSVILNNLFGVDIMEEAVEICKLRLFLKLVAQIDHVEDLEPLPDIDFNIRPGNSLVGYATWDEVEHALEAKFDFDQAARRIAERSADVDATYGAFQSMQLACRQDAGRVSQTKQQLRRQFAELREELDSHLASQYGVDVSDTKRYDAWRASHAAFHWIVEFYGVVRDGGFDVVLGNPPYVEYSKVRSTYTVNEGFTTLSCGNIYAFMVERSLRLVNSSGYLGMIVPLSAVCTDRMAPLRKLLLNNQSRLASYDMRPSALFEGVAQRLCIAIVGRQMSERSLAVGGYRRWSSNERAHLMPTVRYVTSVSPPQDGGPIPKFRWDIESSIRAKLGSGSVKMFWSKLEEPIYVHRIVRYFVKAVDFVPLFVDASGRPGRSDDYKPFTFRRDVQPFMVALLNSSLFYWFWRTNSDGFHCGYGDVFRFPSEHVQAGAGADFAPLESKLMEGLRDTSTEKTISTKSGAIRYQEFSPKGTKEILDEIDVALAAHFGLTAEECDFVINYDIKYRLGADVEDDLGSGR